MKATNENIFNTILFGSAFAAHTTGPNDRAWSDLATLIENLEPEAVGKASKTNNFVSESLENTLPIEVTRESYGSDDTKTRAGWVEITVTVLDNEGKPGASFKIAR